MKLSMGLEAINTALNCNDLQRSNWMKCQTTLPQISAVWRVLVCLCL